MVSSDEKRCPHCGAASPGARWKHHPLIRNWGTGNQIIQIIIGVNIGLYLLSLLISPSVFRSGSHPLGVLAPSVNALQVLGATGTVSIGYGGWWTLVAANYLHGGLLHIFFNMVVIKQICPLIIGLYGTHRFFIIYTLSGVGGFMASFIAGIPVTIGASAALFGTFGAALYYGKSRGGTFGQTIYKQIGIWAVVIIVFGFLVPQVDNWAHIGGLATGALAALLLGYHENSRERLGHRILAGACMVVTLLVLLFAALRGVFVLLL